MLDDEHGLLSSSELSSDSQDVFNGEDRPSREVESEAELTGHHSVAGEATLPPSDANEVQRTVQYSDNDNCGLYEDSEDDSRGLHEGGQDDSRGLHEDGQGDNRGLYEDGRDDNRGLYEDGEDRNRGLYEDDEDGNRGLNEDGDDQNSTLFVSFSQ